MDELAKKISAYLQRYPNSNARDICKEVGADKSAINSCLYSNIETHFLKEGLTPPLWRNVRDLYEIDPEEKEVLTFDDSAPEGEFEDEEVSGAKSLLKSEKRKVEIRGPELDFCIARLDTIKAHFGHTYTGYQARGQVSSDATQDEVMTYANLGVHHAYELQEAWKLMSTKLPKSCHILDIGCGTGLTPAALNDVGVKVQSYQGYDHSESMIWIASRLNPDANMVFDFGEVCEIKCDGMIIINHVFGQDGVVESDLRMWSSEIQRIMPKEVFDLLSIEIPNLPKPAQERRDRFKKFCESQGFQVRLVQEMETPGRHKFPKITQHWQLRKSR